jgi:hypothetical protein
MNRSSRREFIRQIAGSAAYMALADLKALATG